MLTDKQARALKPHDKPVFDGKVTGLLLTPSKSGCKWTLRFTSPVTGKRRDAGLGTYPETSIAEAREKALTMRKQIDSGDDPIDQRNRAREAAAVAIEALTFEKADRLAAFGQPYRVSYENRAERQVQRAAHQLLPGRVVLVFDFIAGQQHETHITATEELARHVELGQQITTGFAPAGGQVPKILRFESFLHNLAVFDALHRAVRRVYRIVFDDENGNTLAAPLVVK
ncbi:MAG TPA: Arm DNA-binding domain-containing protein [Paraburkholderia sp.]|uniref:Arm DNA-binding domain-containing protein n=1 Tax=Paraburkholderia sp. TaxID=1926495 RepID=UPI002ED24674